MCSARATISRGDSIAEQLVEPVARRRFRARAGARPRRVGEGEKFAEVGLVLLGDPVGLGLAALVAHGGVVESAVAAAMQIGGTVGAFVLAQDLLIRGQLLAALEAGAHPSSTPEYSRVCYHPNSSRRAHRGIDHRPRRSRCL